MTNRRTNRQTQRLTIATLASGAPMGQQVYEEEIAARAADAVGADFAIARTIVRSLRSPLPGTARLPAHLMGPASERTRLLAGRWLYRGSDVVHRMSLSLPPAPGPEILTIHDTVAWRFPDESAPEPHAASESRRAAAVVSPSNFSADDAAEHLGIDRPIVIHNGVDQRFFDAPPLAASELAGLGIDGPFVLHAGGASARKNLEGLAGAWPQVRKARPDVVLVLSGPQHPRRDALFGTLDGTRLVGRVANASVPGLIAAARSSSSCPRSTRGSACRPSKGWRAGCPWWRRTAAPCPRSAARTASSSSPPRVKSRRESSWRSTVDRRSTPGSRAASSGPEPSRGSAAPVSTPPSGGSVAG